MTHDYLYYWDKLGQNGHRILLGEIQIGENGFNMSFVIDGTKDSAKVQVLSYTIAEIIKPNTVVWHENTQTWWIVADDKVENIVNEDGWLYRHNLQLEGAIELLNARDLTDCGFNQYTYTIDQFARKLLKLSNFELEGAATQFIYGDNLDKDKLVDYLKSFENYSLLSALREFFDGYNCSLKMEFSQNNYYDSHYIQQCGIRVIPKTGNIDRNAKNIDELFNDVKEIRTMNKNSYGTIVVSNADNIVSTKSKLYPSVGFVKLSGTENIIQPNNACIRLPSNASYVEYVEFMPGIMPVVIGRTRRNYTPDGDSYTPYQEEKWETWVDLTDINSWIASIDFIKNTLANMPQAAEWYDQVDEEFWEGLKTQRTLDIFTELYVVRLYNVTQYDPINDQYISEHDIEKFAKNTNLTSPKPYVLGNINLRNGVTNPESVMYWEKGSNLIKGFNFFGWSSASTDGAIYSTEREGQPLVSFTTHTTTPQTATYDFNIIFGDYKTNGNLDGYVEPKPEGYSYRWICFRVKYIPMTDIKIKYDNSGYSKDTHIYNQNGKFTDGTALSTLINSYKTEIESDNITRYAVGYWYNDMPKVGDIVIKNNDRYVINNVSLDFYINEDRGTLGYYIIGEYTLSKSVATKSLMVNPNTNIRDYSIPQTYNVKRKQLYRDFYELSFAVDPNATNDEYLQLYKVLNTGVYAKEYESHTGIIKLKFNSAYGGGGGTVDGGTAPSSDTWYYQLETTTYFLKKAVYEILDFQDNNIIGYSNQNVSCGFDIRRVFSSQYDDVNTPISYVDNEGKVKDIFIAMCNNNQLMSVWHEYQTEMETAYSQTYDGSLYNYSVFIPADVYNKAKQNCEFEINEENYNKDAIEVPVFEYVCQIDDSDNVIIGNNILDTKEDDQLYLYEAVLVEKNKVDNNSWGKLISLSSITKDGNEIKLDNTNSSNKKSLLFATSSTTISMALYNWVSAMTNSNTIDSSDLLDPRTWINNQNKDLVIIKYTIKNNINVSNGIVTNADANLFMVIRDVKNCPKDEYSLNLKINHYKLN